MPEPRFKKAMETKEDNMDFLFRQILKDNGYKLSGKRARNALERILTDIENSVKLVEHLQTFDGIPEGTLILVDNSSPEVLDVIIKHQNENMLGGTPEYAKHYIPIGYVGRYRGILKFEKTEPFSSIAIELVPCIEFYEHIIDKKRYSVRSPVRGEGSIANVVGGSIIYQKAAAVSQTKELVNSETVLEALGL